ncbi:MAG: hypothetical protein R3B72_19325 [Polyangiaceae bacterium]
MPNHPPTVSLAAHVTEAIFASHEDCASYGQPHAVFANDNTTAGVSTSERSPLRRCRRGGRLSWWR